MSDPNHTMVRFARLLPQSLGGRLALTVLLTNLALLVATVVLAWGAYVWLMPHVEDTRVTNVLDVVASAVHEQASSLDASLVPFAGAARMEVAAQTGEMPPDLAETLDAYATIIEAVAIVFTDPDGVVVYEYGPPSAVARVRATMELAEQNGGALEVDGTPCVIATRKVVGTSATERPGLGSISAVRRIDSAHAELGGVLEVLGPEAATPFDRDTARSVGSDSFNDVIVVDTDGGFGIEAEIPGIDSRSAGSVTYEEVSAVNSLVSRAGSLALVAIVVVLGAGLGMGLAVARAVSRPITELSERVDGYATDVVSGSSPGVPRDERLPRELAELVEAFDRALVDLAAAQKETEVAREALDIAVRDSLEGKILIRDGHVRLINPMATQHLGITTSALGDPFRDAIRQLDAEDDEEVAVDLAALLGASAPRDRVLRVVPPNRPPRWIEFHVHIDHEGSDTILITTRDVTEERRRDALRDEIVGLVSHDLRAPLTVITGYLDLLGRPLDEDSRDKAVMSAQKSAERMQELLEDLLAATRVDEMFALSELSRVSVSDLADEVIVSLSHTSSHHLKLTESCPGEVMGEEKRLRQVLVNLVTNAIKYSPPRSTVTMGVTCNGPTVSVWVEDEGLGVPEDQREAIFERFTRLAAEDGAKRPGVGLGLYIVRAIVESHGGTVTVEDRTGGSGARFVVTLPLAEADASAPGQ